MKKIDKNMKFKGVVDLKKIGKNLPKSTEGIPFKKEVKYMLILNAGVILVSLALFNWLPPEIPVFYGLPTGSEQIRPWWFIAAPSFFSILIIGMNVILTQFAKQDFVKKALMIAAMTTTFLSLITTLKILFLVGNIF